MEKFNVKKIENAILTDCPDDAIQEVIETADIPIYGRLLLDVDNNDGFLHFSFRARDCNIVYSFDVIGFTISPVAENDETIDVEIPLYKEECHALSEKIAILDKAEPELPKEDNEKEFVQLEFDFDKE